MITGIVLALLALGVFTAVTIATWALQELAHWVFGLFANKDPSVDVINVIKDQSILDEVVIAVEKRDAELADRLRHSLTGDGKPAALAVWQNGTVVKDVNILKAKDASVDEVQGITRFERSGVIKQY